MSTESMTSEAVPVERLVRVSIDLTKLGTRNERGDRITAEWGEPDESGIYTPVFTAQADQQLAAALDLGQAWQEAEAALPEGWRLYGVTNNAVPPVDGKYWASAHGPVVTGRCDMGRDHEDYPRENGYGPTPAEALRNLAARLDQQGGEK